MINDKLAQRLRDIIGVTSATPSMTEQQLGLAMGRIQEICESALAAHEAEKQAVPVAEVYRYGKDSHGREWHGVHWYDPNLDVLTGTKLYLHPAPPSESDKDDAERWRAFIGLEYQVRAEWAANLSLVPVLISWVDSLRAARAKKDPQ